MVSPGLAQAVVVAPLEREVVSLRAVLTPGSIPLRKESGSKVAAGLIVSKRE